MTLSRTTRANVALVALLFGLVGCALPETTDTAKATEPSEVTVPLKKTDPDKGYVVKDSVIVTNGDYTLGTLGSITLEAKLLELRCKGHDPVNGCQGGYDWHNFSGKLLLKDGTSIECAEPQENSWDSTYVERSFEDIELQCDDELKLSDVKSAVLVKQEPIVFQ